MPATEGPRNQRWSNYTARSYKGQAMKTSRIRLASFHLLGVIGMRREDILLTSFSRSGNTWLRFLLCNLISIREWDGKTVDFPLLNKTMPEFGVNNLLAPWPYITIPRVVKTHKPYLPFFSRNRSIGIIRDPRDVMVSHYHKRKYRGGTYSGTFVEFIRDRHLGLDGWFRHYISWKDRWTLVVRYEDLRIDTFREFSRILNLLGVSYPEDTICEAIHRSSIENVRRVEQPPERKEARFARDGQTQQWFAYFNQQDLEYYHELVEKYKVYIYTDMKT